MLYRCSVGCASQKRGIGNLPGVAAPKQAGGLWNCLRLLLLRLGLIFAFVLCTGCHSLPLPQKKCLFARKQKSENLGEVSVTRWLNTSMQIPITEQSRSIQDVLNKSTSAEDELLKLKVQQLAKDDLINVDARDFNDNCVILVRGNQAWYFLDPGRSIFEIKNIALNPDDAILTKPFYRTPFFSDNRDTDSEIFVFGVANDGPQRQIRKGKTFDSYLSSFLDMPAKREIWTATIITRKTGSFLHHLVMAVPSPGQDFAQMQYTKPLADAHFQTGDLVELTNLSIFAQRF
jgi:hypothetical protein